MANAETNPTRYPMPPASERLEPHPLSLIFPSIPDGEFDALKASIVENGLRHPVVLYEGLILDGRHRYRACVEAGATVATKMFDGDYEAARRLVIDENVNRRHLTTSQRGLRRAG